VRIYIIVIHKYTTGGSSCEHSNLFAFLSRGENEGKKTEGKLLKLQLLPIV
jgi:hypothetical protein